HPGRDGNASTRAAAAAIVRRFILRCPPKTPRWRLRTGAVRRGRTARGSSRRTGPFSPTRRIRQVSLLQREIVQLVRIVLDDQDAVDRLLLGLAGRTLGEV